MDITEIIWKYHKQHHANTFNNLDGLGKFLKRHKRPNLIEEETGHQNGPVSVAKIKFMVKSFCKENPSLHSFRVEHYQTFKRERDNTNSSQPLPEN